MAADSGRMAAAMFGWAFRNVAILIALSSAVALLFSSVTGSWHASAPPHPTAPPATQAHASAAASNEIVFTRQRDGHFYVDADVNGARIHFLVDTGASVVALSPQDALAAGFSPTALNFTTRVATANGVTQVAQVTLRKIDIQQLSLYDVPAVVLADPLPVSLLGMSFLSRVNLTTDANRMTLTKR